MKKLNPIDVVFKDKAKKKEKEYLKQLSGAPSVMDIDIGKRLKELKDFNEGRDGSDDDNDDDEPDVPPTPRPSSSRTSGDIFPTPPYIPAVADGDNLTSTQRFLLDRPSVGREGAAEAIGQELTATTPWRVAFSDNITRLSHGAENRHERRR